MDLSKFNAEITARPGPRPELGDLLTEEELEGLWFSYALEFGHLLDIPVRAISSGIREPIHRFLCHRGPIRTQYLH